ncbi:MAG: homocysteine S-methyltransferase family protein [bacterium]|nr:MAG: homocysteine S-methyltransferase family protein [bacterium]
MTFRERLQQGIVLFDGAMGTQIQALKPTNEEWDGKIGCSEILNLTVPEKIQKIHENYLAVGSDVIETNTFGTNEIVLSEYNLQEHVFEINQTAAQLAREAVEKFAHEKPCFAAGSIGPSTKVISLRQTDFETMYRSYSRQARGLIKGGVDSFVIETCQDLLKIKTALLAISDTMLKYEVDLPIIVSVTVETNGTLLLGSEIGAVLAVLEPFDINVLGLNCATGPKHMRPYIKQICQNFCGPVLCQPNAGLPQNIDGEMAYTLSPKDFADVLTQFFEEMGVQIIGGCCGTTPVFIKELSERVPKLKIADRKSCHQPSLASLLSAQKLQQDIPPFFVSERANTNGSKKFREFILNNDWDGIVEVAKQQQHTGAPGLDLCVVYTGRNEIADMAEAITRIVNHVDLPLFIDSTDIEAIVIALKLYCKCQENYAIIPD